VCLRPHAPVPPLPAGDNCQDIGEVDGRTLDQIFGCLLFGRVSRFPYDPASGTVTGPEQIIIDGQDNNRQACVQFVTHGMTGLALADDGAILFSHGDGASYQGPDEGQFGNGAALCMDDPAYPGAFRAQNPNKINGKIWRMDPNTLERRIFSRGHRNPFRLSVWNGAVYSSDTGAYAAGAVLPGRPCPCHV